MSKPEEFPHHVWDEAVKHSGVYGAQGEALSELRLDFARAILAAEQREREACAALATNFATTSNTRDVDLVMQEAAAADTAEGIAAAIRNRGEHHD